MDIIPVSKRYFNLPRTEHIAMYTNPSTGRLEIVFYPAYFEKEGLPVPLEPVVFTPETDHFDSYMDFAEFPKNTVLTND